MSWPLFNHNYYIDPLGDGTGPGGNTPGGSGNQGPPDDAVVTPIFTGGQYIYNQNLRGHLCVSEDGQKVMVADTGALDGGFEFSSDGGETFNPATINGISGPAVDADSFISDMKYDDTTDRWYVSIFDLSAIDSYWYYSDDDGANWVQILVDGISRFGYGIDLQPGGQLVMSGLKEGSTIGRIVRKNGVSDTGIGVDGFYPSAHYDAVKVGAYHYGFSTALGVDYLSKVSFSGNTWEFAGGWELNTYQICFAGGNNGSRTYAMPTGAPASTSHQLKLLEENTVFSVEADVGGPTIIFPAATRFRDVFYSAVATTWQWVSVGFGEADNTKIYVNYSNDGDNWSTSSVTFTFADGCDLAYMARLQHKTNDTWMLSFRNDTTGNHEVVELDLTPTEAPPLGTIDEGQALTGTLVHSGDTTFAVNDMLRGLITTDGAGRVMIYPGLGEIWYSSNFAGTFAETGYSNTEAYYCTDSVFDSSTNTWFINRYQQADHVSRTAYSTDNFETLSYFGQSSTASGFSYGSGIDLFGSKVVMGSWGLSSTAYLEVFNYPPGASGDFSSSQTATYNFRGHAVVGSECVAIKASVGTAGTPDQVVVIDANDASHTTVTVDMPSSLYNWRVTRFTKVGSVAAIHAKSVSGSVITFHKYTSPVSFPVPEFTIDFGVAGTARYMDMGYDPVRGMLLAAAVLDSGTPTTVNLHQSLDQGVTWSSVPHTLTLPAGYDIATAIERESVQLEYVGNDYWLLAYESTDGFMKYVRFQLEETPLGNFGAPTNNNLTQAIRAQQPDIFYKLDEAYPSTRVERAAPYLTSLLWQSTATVNGGGAWNTNDSSIFTVSNDGLKIMIARGDLIYYSGNAGVSFSETAALPVVASAKVQSMAYDDNTDTFYVCWGTSGGQNSIYRSGGNGASWTEIYNPTVQWTLGHVRYSIRAIAVLSGGRIGIAGYYSGGRSRLTVISDPTGTPSYQTIISPVAFDGAGFLVIEAGGYIYVSTSNGAGGVYYVKSDLSGPVLTLSVTSDVFQGATDGEWILRAGSSVNGNFTNSTLNYAWVRGSTGAVTNASIEADEVMSSNIHNYSSVWYGDGKWWLGQVVQDFTRMKIWSTTTPGTVDGFEFVGYIILDASIFNNDSGNIPWYNRVIKWDQANARWLLAYWDDSATKILYLREYKTYAIEPNLSGIGSVNDLGTKQYPNTVSANEGAALVFQRPGVVSDGGFAVAAASTTAAAIQAGKGLIPTSNQHAHLFIFSIDSSVPAAQDRVLLSAGNTAFNYGYQIVVKTDNTVQYKTQSGNVTDAKVLPNDSAIMMVVVIDQDSGEVTFHYDLDEDNTYTGAPMVDTPNANDYAQTLFSAWEGGDTYTFAADGVTVDYYAQFPLANFDITALRQAAVEAGFLSGPITIPTTPTAPTSSGTLMLCHADTPPTRRWRTWSSTTPRYVWTIDEEVTPFGSSPYYELGSWDAGIGAANVDLVDGGKFGGGCLFVPAKTLGEPNLPYTNPYWGGWHQRQWGTRQWTIEAQVKPATPRCYFFTTMRIWGQAGKYYKFGGVTVRLNSWGGITYVVIQVGKSLSNALKYVPYKPRLSVSPAYIVLGENNREYAYDATFVIDEPLTTTSYKHFAISRGANGAWYVALNGKIGRLLSSTGDPTAPLISEAAGGGTLDWGRGPYTGGPDQNASLYYGEAVRLDELRVTIDEALFTGPYTPPTGPYTL